MTGQWSALRLMSKQSTIATSVEGIRLIASNAQETVRILCYYFGFFMVMKTPFADESGYKVGLTVLCLTLTFAFRSRPNVLHFLFSFDNL